MKMKGLHPNKLKLTAMLCLLLSVAGTAKQENVPTGALEGVFSVSALQQVRFSMGNLQYMASSNTWRFAENQYDFVGLSNNHISSTYDGWIDLFGWGTSGNNHGAVAYQPWSTSIVESHYNAYGSATYDLFSQTGQADWGYNAISNGGGQTNQWRTLTQEEWAYLINSRNTASGIRFAKGIVNDIKGLILLPDDWSSSTYTLNDTNTASAHYTVNVIPASDWAVLQNAGAVFLPAAGSRYDVSVNGYSTPNKTSANGYYWTSTHQDTDGAYMFKFNNYSCPTQWTQYRYIGMSVRLVCTVQSSSVVQTTNFNEGWNWWSTYIDAGDVLTQLEDGLTPNGQTIKSKSKSRIYRNGSWMGGLDAIEAEGSYRVQTAAACTVDITGAATTTPTAHPITLTPGWTWIGYPTTATMTVTEALADLTPTQNDVIKSKNSTSVYRNGMWMNNFTITPGTGLMYKSNATTNLTLVYPSSDAKGETRTTSNEERHWKSNASAYPGNMTVIAVVELDGTELAPETADGYELAAFANGECRGSFRLMPVEGRCMAILTIAGDETADLRFALYNAATGEEYHDATQSLNYETDAVVGDMDTPFVVCFHEMTDIVENGQSLQVYPNPVAKGESVTIGLTTETTREVCVEIINALGMVVETRRATSLQEMAAPKVAGIYTLRITVEGNGTYYRKLMVR